MNLMCLPPHPIKIHPLSTWQPGCFDSDHTIFWLEYCLLNGTTRTAHLPCKMLNIASVLPDSCPHHSSVLNSPQSIPFWSTSRERKRVLKETERGEERLSLASVSVPLFQISYSVEIKKKFSDLENLMQIVL